MSRGAMTKMILEEFDCYKYRHLIIYLTIEYRLVYNYFIMKNSLKIKEIIEKSR